MRIIAKGKSINLNPRTKPKKQNKYSEISKSSINKNDYKFEIGTIVTYEGGLCKGKESAVCEIIGRSKTRNGKQYYKVEFEDGLLLESIMEVFKEKEVEIEIEIEVIEEEDKID